MTFTIDQIKKLREGITPGEWIVNTGWCGIKKPYSREHPQVVLDQANAEWFAASPAIIDQLLEEIERLKSINPDCGGTHILLMGVTKSYENPKTATELLVRYHELTGPSPLMVYQFKAIADLLK